jgi:hypothetical protein
MSFVSHIASKMLGNGWDAVTSYFDREPALSEGVRPADVYKTGVPWRVLAKRLEWHAFPWAISEGPGGSEAQVLRDWFAAVGMEPLPLPVGWPLLLIDTALLMGWEGVPVESASPPPLDGYAMYDAVKGSTKGATHHPAWLPLALQMALTAEECGEARPRCLATLPARARPSATRHEHPTLQREARRPRHCSPTSWQPWPA